MRYDVAFLFPGQGSQRPGMGLPWVETPSWSIVGQVSEATGIDVAYLLLKADADHLRDTLHAQISVFTLGLVVHDAVRRLGMRPLALAGHSLGEYTALVAAGALSIEDGASLVIARGEAMRAATAGSDGTMTAILGLEDDKVTALCAATDGDVWPANYNTPGQVVIGGDPAAVAAAGSYSLSAGAKGASALDVSGAFHTPYMRPALDELRAALNSVPWNDTQDQVVTNVDACPHETSDAWARLLATQLVSPVRWRQSVETLAVVGCAMFVEMGARTLTPMMRRILGGATSVAVVTPEDLLDVQEKGNGPTSNAPLHTAAGTIPELPVFSADIVVEGEMPTMRHKVVVSRAGGDFTPADDLAPGTEISAGQVLGHAGGHAVQSPFAGIIDHVLALAGERLNPYQSVAWLLPR